MSTRSGPGSAGKWIGGVVGSGSLVAVNRWTELQGGSVVHGNLNMIGPRGLKRIATGPPTVRAQSADAGRIAVLRADGVVALYSQAGRLQLTVTPPSTREIALQGRNLVVLTKTRSLEVYDSATGSLLKKLSVQGTPKGEPGSLDVERGIAVYTVTAIRNLTVAPEVHVVDLTTGQDKLLARLEARGLTVFAQIEPPGLVYASSEYTRQDLTGGTLVYVPFARVAAAVS